LGISTYKKILFCLSDVLCTKTEQNRYKTTIIQNIILPKRAFSLLKIAPFCKIIVKKFGKYTLLSLNLAVI